MTTTTDGPCVFDPDRELWVPGRRRFLFLGLGAAASALFPAPTVHHLTLYGTPVQAPFTDTTIDVVMTSPASVIAFLKEAYPAELYLRPYYFEHQRFNGGRHAGPTRSHDRGWAARLGRRTRPWR